MKVSTMVYRSSWLPRIFKRRVDGATPRGITQTQPAMTCKFSFVFTRRGDTGRRRLAYRIPSCAPWTTICTAFVPLGRNGLGTGWWELVGERLGLARACYINDNHVAMSYECTIIHFTKERYCLELQIYV
jgi:hypothetical protein